MKIVFTEAAQAKLLPLLEPEHAKLKLLYDTEGCGCVVSGVPALQLVEGPGPYDRPGEGQPIPFLFEQRHEVFFESELKVDYSAEKGQFSLKSDQQIYTNHLRLIRQQN
ncbi:iron-sulfur cluster biosynthesis family protein [Paenibacillus sp. GCM10012307]|uniref:Iron-sulfur cluster biosynthesis family protein n=1 Tax=Paenibacillus roseus TaxID=2798579 RepID=A0A934MSV3_9BACL|nr:iron-sulfur cluster biosynthesis family protein [Paenibacillus roseus]MBJ6363624.1 iron-sulfur cluster biosynthesis family protein [Paenibacillus roseus]